MTKDNQIVVRARDFELGPDVEMYIQNMKKNGILEKLSNEGNLNAETLKNTNLGKMCDVFVEEMGKTLKSGDILIFGDDATFDIFGGEAYT